jgi:BMFP domain-containing protein YqiC
MDPIRHLIEFLNDRFGDLDAEFEARIRELFGRFELVPKHEYEAHLAVLESLEAEVRELETRLRALESKP